MIFEVDKQTLKDLDLIPQNRNDTSVISFFNRTQTNGGKEMLYKLFRFPVSDLTFLRCREEEISFFFQNDCFLKLNAKCFDFIEHYLNINKNPLHNNIIDATFDGIKNKLSLDGDYWVISNGLAYIIQLFIDLKSFIKETKSLSPPATLKEDFDRIESLLFLKQIEKILDDPPPDGKNLSFRQINNLDHLFRVENKNQFREVLDIVYKIDVLQSLSQVMKNDGFSLPEYSTEPKAILELTDAFHPSIPAPVKNSFSFKGNSNLSFLTGPNMSGKSTFLKTIGLIIYLSHLGFPVPAKKLKISIFDGLFTTINISDNLNIGYSHFYSEVKRVKDIIMKISANKKLVVIFDELFRGTNVKDAFDATLMIISALARIRDNLFFISTHIMEVAGNLENKGSIMFHCFESSLVNQEPLYDFKLKEGTSNERVGMIIIKNEHITEILEQIINKQMTENDNITPHTKENIV